ncbi:hypothetical protein HF325_006877 [Metschnikowia pulcherrima]|uniref:Actin n=1 Tax=Metschnikowia pulcherrima TaxID=27326 RepID=A0A8H7L8C9_9ASCO|nr:hypothetical protein HF325_006877 [Metschnikowia pulcherrima]
MSSTNTAAAVYGGDEINAIVLDIGLYSTRIGYAGDDFPKVIVLSYHAKDADGKYLFDGSLDFPKENREVLSIVKDGMVKDWPAAIAQWRHYFDTVLALDYAEQPLLVTEPVWAPQEYRQKLVETIFAEFDFPALYLAKTPTCISFQQGRLSCLVVDIGHDCASVVPVVDGMCLLKNSMRTHYAGHFLNDHIEDLLLEKFDMLESAAKYAVKTKEATKYPEMAKWTTRTLPALTALFKEYQHQKTYTEFKELLLETPDKKITKTTTYLEDDIRTMEFPAGQIIEVSLERFAIADALFEPGLHPFHLENFAKKYPPNNGELAISSPYDDYRPMKRARKAETEATPTPVPENGVQTIRGLSQMITHALASVDIDLRTSIAHNVIVTGGTSLIPQLTERLNTELLSANPGLKVRLHALGNANERTNQTWIGASVLASLGAFHQMWVSPAEYEEAGPERIFTQRFR